MSAQSSTFEPAVVDADTGEAILPFAVGVAGPGHETFVWPEERLLCTGDGKLESLYPWIKLERDRGKIHVYAVGYAPAREGLSAKGDFSAERILMHRGASVSGQVVDASGAGVGGARVSVEPAPDSGDPFASIGIAVYWCCFPHAYTRSDGRFVVHHVPPGRHIVRAGAQSFSPSVSGEIDVPGEGDVAAENLCLDVGGAIAGTIRNATWVRLGLGPLGPIPVDCDNGKFKVESLPPGTYALTYGDTGCMIQTQAVRVSRGEVTRISW